MFLCNGGNVLPVTFRVDPFPLNSDLDALFAVAWNASKPRDFAAVLARSLTHFCAYDGDDLIGFVNVAWDGGEHAFILDTCVHPDFRRRGIASELVMRAITEARTRGAGWLHVDFEPHLAGFYAGCGFRPSDAGLIAL